ncbi:MAG TPA: transcription antitermination factor NusB, partial [Clostridia bacterium]|nr:transcription antitermination factor NusB [Clostridia bacterium]
ELSPADRGLCTELVMGTLRWQSALDAGIAKHSSQKVNRLDPEVLIALRLGAYQIRHLERVPSRAAVNESVELVKRAHKKSAAPFTNAVLRKLACAPQVAPATNGDVSGESLAEQFAHPPWIAARWVLEYGIGNAQRICEYDQAIPPTTLRMLDASAEETLRADGVELAPGELLTSARRVLSGDIVHARAFREGHVLVQDEASQLVASLVGHGARLLDCCAAPGGKTAVLAQRNPEATIIAADLHEHRTRLLQERVRARNVQVITADATHLPFGAEFDRVLADVPCSGTGTLARNPEIKWKLGRQDLRDLHARQVAILSATLNHVAPGGRLLYSTCSLEVEENEGVISEALAARTGFSVVDCAQELRGLRQQGELAIEPERLVRGGFLRTLQGVHPGDGFFAAILQRD